MLTNKTNEQLLKLYRQCLSESLEVWSAWDDERCRKGNGGLIFSLPFIIDIGDTCVQSEITCQRELEIINQVLFERKVLGKC